MRKLTLAEMVLAFLFLATFWLALRQHSVNAGMMDAMQRQNGLIIEQGAFIQEQGAIIQQMQVRITSNASRTASPP